MKRKTILFSVIALLLLIGGMGCGKEETNEVRLRDFSYVGCKENTDKTKQSFSESIFKNQEYIEYRAIEDGYLHIKHINAQFNCCPDTIKVNFSTENNGFVITEDEQNPKCNCFCNYDLEYNIGPLLSKEYTIFIYKGNIEQAKFDINYNSSIKGKVTI